MWWSVLCVILCCINEMWIGHEWIRWSKMKQGLWGGEVVWINDAWNEQASKTRRCMCMKKWSMLWNVLNVIRYVCMMLWNEVNR
jgi:hypothetical protein